MYGKTRDLHKWRKKEEMWYKEYEGIDIEKKQGYRRMFIRGGKKDHPKCYKMVREVFNSREREGVQRVGGLFHAADRRDTKLWKVVGEGGGGKGMDCPGGTRFFLRGA